MTSAKGCKCGWLAALWVALALLSPVGAANDGHVVQIQIDNLPTQAEVTAWTAYGLGLAAWVEKNKVADSAPLGPFIPSFSAELFARQSQIQIWRELDERSSVPYMDTMLNVDAAGFLSEYVWHFHYRPGWVAPPTEDRMSAFSRWRAEHLSQHQPQTGARIVFGPPKKK